jgi:SecD/SecF fusion protein
LSLGLDLQGGMSVTLEISTADLVNNLSGKSRNKKFRAPFEKTIEQYGDDEDFIDNFYTEFKKNDADASLAKIFSMHNKDLFKSNYSNDKVIEVLKEQKNVAITNMEQVMNTRINKFGVNQPNIQRQPNSGRIIVELPGVKDKIRVRKLLQSTANLEFWTTSGNYELITPLVEADKAIGMMVKKEKGIDEKLEKDTAKVKSNEVTNVDSETEEAVATIENDSAKLAIAKAEEAKKKAEAAKKAEEDKNKKLEPQSILTLLSLEAAQATNEQNQKVWVNGIMGAARSQDTAQLNAWLNHRVSRAVFPKNIRFMWGAKPILNEDGTETDVFYLYAIKVTTRDGSPNLDGSVITEARQDFDQNTNQVEVVMHMNAEGAEKWANLTNTYKGQAMAITMDGAVYSAPTIQSQITGGVSQISGNFSIEEADDLANILKSGTLPAKARIIDEVIVGPTLGEDNIRSGFISFVIALILVLIYMWAYYAKAGLIANVALIANIFFLIGSLASLQASLTLPGIAGIVLTLGMAVDANVIIFERIKEELRDGKGVKLAVEEGYKNALTSIIDANITTLLTAIVLATFGSGPVLGFATTLIIGIFTSLFCALFISRLIITEMLERKKNISFSNNFSENLMSKSKIDFLGKRKIFYVVSSLIILGGIASLASRGLDYGVEFTGGRTFTVEFLENEADYELIKTNLAKEFVVDGQEMKPEVKMIDNKFKAKITTKFMSGVENENAKADSIVQAKLDKGLKGMGDYEIVEERRVGASVSEDLKFDSILSVVIALVIIFLYIVFRFQKWQYGAGALIALFHDVIITLSMFSIFYGILPFSMEIDQAFIAAILTVVGYSINDTVIVFDRIREYLNAGKKEGHNDLINKALNSTLSRTLNTSLTTLVVLVAIFLFGGEAIKGFSFALLIGVVVGTYSSLFVATPLIVDFTKAKKD